MPSANRRRRRKQLLYYSVRIGVLVIIAGQLVLIAPNPITRAMHYQPSSTRCTDGSIGQLSSRSAKTVSQNQQRYWLEPDKPKVIGEWTRGQEKVFGIVYFFPQSCGYVATTYSKEGKTTGFRRSMVFTRDGRVLLHPPDGICVSDTMPYVQYHLVVQGCERIVPLGSSEIHFSPPPPG